MVLAEVLEAVHTPAALAACQDRAQKDPVSLADPGRQVRFWADLLEDPHRFVPEEPGNRGPGVAVEERPRVRPADAAGLDAKHGAARIELGVLRIPYLHGVHAGHERGPHDPPPISSTSA